MGFFRFRKSIKIFSGIRWNLNKTGSSFMFGGRGLKHTVGPKGSRTTVGLPGTGISYTQIHQRSTTPPPKNAAGRARNFHIAGAIFLGIWLVGKLADFARTSSATRTGVNPSSVEPSTVQAASLRKTDDSFRIRALTPPATPIPIPAVTAPPTPQPVSTPLRTMVAPSTPSPTPPPKSESPRTSTAARPLPTGDAAEAAKLRAVARYPQLGIAGSPLNTAFLARVRQYQIENPQVFDDPEWPTRIARECVVKTR
jgi:hypothetical protein